jgi:hypothetical protein
MGNNKAKNKKIIEYALSDMNKRKEYDYAELSKKARIF